MPLHRRVARLSPQNYFGRQAYFVTICCDRRAALLGDAATARCVLALLHQCAAKDSFVLHAYCLMPDHCHILAEGQHDRSDLCEFIRVFKQRTAFAFRKSDRRSLWEMSYYDHILRPSDRIEDVSCYIWWNPVRKNPCARPQEFPFSGSQTIDWMKGSSSAASWSPPWKTPQ